MGVRARPCRLARKVVNRRVSRDASCTCVDGVAVSNRVDETATAVWYGGDAGNHKMSRRSRSITPHALIRETSFKNFSATASSASPGQAVNQSMAQQFKRGEQSVSERRT